MTHGIFICDAGFYSLKSRQSVKLKSHVSATFAFFVFSRIEGRLYCRRKSKNPLEKLKNMGYNSSVIKTPRKEVVL